MLIAHLHLLEVLIGVLQAKADNERQVVTEASLITVAIIGAEGLDASVLFVFFKEEGGIVNVGLGNGITEGRTNKDMIDALP